MVTDSDILAFFRNKLPEKATWIFKRIPFEMDDILQEYIESDDMVYAINDYVEKFGVDVSTMNFDNYYPWERAWFFRKWFTEKPLKQTKKALTIKMFSESAIAGYWLYE
jgi:Protein of unknown function (DUF1493)